MSDRIQFSIIKGHNYDCEDPIFGASCIRCDAKFGNHVVYVAWLVKN